MLEGIIHEQEAMLRRISHQHEQFASKSSSMSSLGSELNENTSLDLYKILDIPKGTALTSYKDKRPPDITIPETLIEGDQLNFTS